MPQKNHKENFSGVCQKIIFAKKPTEKGFEN